MLLSDVAPSFRCCQHRGATCVEIPARWRDARYWPNGRVDTQAALAIAGLLRDAGTRHPIYAEGLARGARRSWLASRRVSCRRCEVGCGHARAVRGLVG